MEKRYKDLLEVPEDQREVIKNLLKKGVVDLNESGQFDLSDDMVTIFIVLTRLGIL